MTQTKTNIFAMAKKVEKTTTKKEDKAIIDCPILEAKVVRFNELKSIIDALEAEKKMLEGDIKSVGTQKFIEIYQQKKIKPESFVIEDKDGGRVLFMVVDKYTSITPEKKEIISQILPEFLNTKTEYSFNPEVLERNIEAISNAIMESEMSDEDKADLIFAQEITTIEKGSIDKLHTTSDIQGSMALISPILMLKPQK